MHASLLLPQSLQDSSFWFFLVNSCSLLHSWTVPPEKGLTIIDLQVRLRGVVAATNFSLSEYRVELADYHRKQQVILP